MKKLIIFATIFALILGGIFYIFLINRAGEQVQGFVCYKGSTYRKSTGLVISKETREKYKGQIKELSQNPNSAEDFFNLGMVYRNIDELDKSCEMFLKSIKLDANVFLAFSALGTVYQERQDYKQSEQAFKKAIELNPEDANTYAKLAFLYRANLNKTKEEIIDFYEKSVITTSGNVNLARDYVSYLEEVKEYQKAIEIWEALIERGSGDPEIIRKKIEELKSKL